MSTDALNPRLKSKFAKYTPKVRQQGEALPSTYNLLKAPKYTPDPMQSVRTGADDHLKYKSKLGAA